MNYAEMESVCLKYILVKTELKREGRQNVGKADTMFRKANRMLGIEELSEYLEGHIRG